MRAKLSTKGLSLRISARASRSQTFASRQMRPIGPDIVIDLRAGQDQRKFRKFAHHIFKGQFEAVARIVEDRHGESIAASDETIVDDRCGENARRLEIAVDIVELVALDADARVHSPS